MNNLALVFPGQGSQSQNMLSDLHQQFAAVDHLFLQASEVLGEDLWDIIVNNPNDKLNQTQYTQPALLVADVAVYQCWQELKGPMPKVMAGHSLGEYSALVCSDTLQFKDAVNLVFKRGEYMQQAVSVGEGAMAAIIGLGDDVVRTICEKAAEGEIVSPANYNSIGQIVIAGKTEAVDRAIHEAKAAGAKIAKKIPVSVPSHCQLMQSAAEKLAHVLEKTKFHSPAIPVIQNTNVKSYKDANDIRQSLINQLTQPVRWVETIKLMQQKYSIDKIVECGPGKVLTGLIKRIDKSISTYNTFDKAALENSIAALGE